MRKEARVEPPLLSNTWECDPAWRLPDGFGYSRRPQRSRPSAGGSAARPAKQSAAMVSDDRRGSEALRKLRGSRRHSSPREARLETVPYALTIHATHLLDRRNSFFQ